CTASKRKILWRSPDGSSESSPLDPGRADRGAGRRRLVCGEAARTDAQRSLRLLREPADADRLPNRRPYAPPPCARGGGRARRAAADRVRGQSPAGRYRGEAGDGGAGASADAGGAERPARGGHLEARGGRRGADGGPQPSAKRPTAGGDSSGAGAG